MWVEPYWSFNLNIRGWQFTYRELQFVPFHLNFYQTSSGYQGIWGPALSSEQKLPLKAIQSGVRNTSLHPTHGNSLVQEHHPRQSYLCSLLCCFSFLPTGKTQSFSFSLQIFYFCVFICLFICLFCPKPLLKTCFSSYIPHLEDNKLSWFFLDDFP